MTNANERSMTPNPASSSRDRGAVQVALSPSKTLGDLLARFRVHEEQLDVWHGEACELLDAWGDLTGEVRQMLLVRYALWKYLENRAEELEALHDSTENPEVQSEISSLVCDQLQPGIKPDPAHFFDTRRWFSDFHDAEELSTWLRDDADSGLDRGRLALAHLYLEMREQERAFKARSVTCVQVAMRLVELRAQVL